MKKTIFTLMLMLASVVAISAQGLTSNPWFTMLEMDGDEAAFVIDFDDDGTCAIVFGADEVMDEDGTKMTISMTAMVPGTYKLDGKNLSITLDEAGANVDVDYAIEGVDAATKKMMDAMIKPELEKQKPELKKMIMSGMPKMNNMKVVSVSKEKLVLADEEGTEMTFMPAPDE